MKSFREFVGGAETAEELEEGAFCNIGSATLFTHIVSLSKQIKRTKEVNEQNVLLASQNTYIGALAMAVGKFLEKSNR